jgi:DNA anti-recombination protein RmuC
MVPVIMYEMKDRWTDERMDGFATHVDQRFDAVDQRFDAVNQRFDGVDKRLDRVETDMRDLRGEMNSQFDRVNARLDGLQRTMLQISGGVIATLLAGFIGLIATQL